MRARYLRTSNILPLLDRILEYVIHFIITINVIAFLKCRAFVLLNSDPPFSGLPVSCLDFLVCLFLVCHFPLRVFFRLSYSGLPFSVARYFVVDYSTGFLFSIGQETLPWQPILGAKWAKSAHSLSFVALASKMEWNIAILISKCSIAMI